MYKFNVNSKYIIINQLKYFTQVGYRNFNHRKLVSDELNWSMYSHLIFVFMLTAVPAVAGAEWTIVTHPGTENNTATRVAHVSNNAGYSLEIYHDANNVIRTRFGMNKLARLNGKNCPTFQVDKRPAQNRSINDAPCLSEDHWAEFVMGYINNDQVTSTAMHNLMNGNTITYRFILRDTGYAETSFSLNGSKRVLLEVLGKNLAVFTEKDLP